MKIIVERPKPKAFVICPVRNIEPEFRDLLEQEIKRREKYFDVYYPARDTDQNDSCGLRICNDNLRAIKRAKIVFVAWDGKSQGSLFDLGMAFALKKEIIILHDNLFPEKTDGKSFANMLREYSGANARQFEIDTLEFGF